MTTSLIDKPRRDLVSRCGTYRALYRISDEEREVVIPRIEHRRDAYRPQS